MKFVSISFMNCSFYFSNVFYISLRSLCTDLEILRTPSTGHCLTKGIMIMGFRDKILVLAIFSDCHIAYLYT